MDRRTGGACSPRFSILRPVSVDLAARPVFLVGMMGVGKSTIGPLLAARLGRDFLDTDHEIEREAGQSVAEIFAREGEAGFRRRERQAIGRAAGRGAVVALGGGAIAQPGAADRLRALGEVVYLEADAALLLERIGDPASRPLLAGLEAEARRAKLDALLAERRPHYARATITVDASGPPEAVADEIARRLGAGRPAD